MSKQSSDGVIRKIRLSLILMLVFALLGYVAGAAIAYFTENLNDIVGALMSTYALAGAGVGAVAGLAIGLCTKTKKDTKNDNTGTDISGQKVDINFDSRFISGEELKTHEGLIATTWKDLPNCKKTGFPFRHKIVGGRTYQTDRGEHITGGTYEINMKEETHCLVLGTTGTGKTQLLADPTIRILAHSGQKPSIVMTDPKGELYADNAEILREEGYNIMVLNLNDPYSSSKWNPMEKAYTLYKRAENLTSEVKKISHVTPEQAGYQRLSPENLRGAEYGDSWFAFEGRAFPTKQLLEEQLDIVKLQLEAEAKSHLDNIAITLIPDDPNVKDKTWNDGSRDFVKGVMYAMLEDTRNPELGMTLDKFNFFNLYRILNVRNVPQSDKDSVIKDLAAYSEGRDDIEGNVKTLMNTVCGAPATTQKSFLSTMTAGLGKILGDEGVLYMTSGTDIDFNVLAEKPTAFFIRIPDHRTERHPLGVLCIRQLYTALVDIANKTVDSKGRTGSLNRPVYFILDEFGNMPAIPDFGTMVTVARSRKIFFEIILQSYSQLDIKYGADEAKNIKGNFQMELFLGCEDQNTLQQFSESCGEYTVFHEEVNESTNTKDESGGKNISKSIQRTRRPLVDKQELRQLEKWTIVAKLFRESIMKDKMTPFFANDLLVKKPSVLQAQLGQKLDVKAIYYDIKLRNEKVLKRTAMPRPNPFW